MYCYWIAIEGLDAGHVLGTLRDAPFVCANFAPAKLLPRVPRGPEHTYSTSQVMVTRLPPQCPHVAFCFIEIELDAPLHWIRVVILLLRPFGSG